MATCLKLKGEFGLPSGNSGSSGQQWHPWGLHVGLAAVARLRARELQRLCRQLQVALLQIGIQVFSGLETPSDTGPAVTFVGSSEK